ncbi:Tat-binding like [Actinidia chinensis var. chinensis]|uniref:Tat-binding like n=1 Tax=Actinidia chinensis var. chinensis TaxID=1590841 RepID=A0A2R6PSG5_ACTCC|nr:Tat-binding like [Actinidia chinensis var. chinensis]
MRLSRSISVSARRKNQRFGSSRTRKKQKRLDAICEKAYNRNHGGAKTESNHFVGGGGSELNESELRRSTRVRKAPVVLDASPRPAKKRRRFEKRSGDDSGGRGKRKDGVKVESPCSTSRDVEEEPGSWRSRLRSRARNATLGVREKKGTSPRGKRKLFEDLDEINQEVMEKAGDFDREEELEGGLSTVVKSKRPGRIKASNVSRSVRLEIELCFDKEKNKVEGEIENNVVEEHSETNEVEVLDENGGKDLLDLNIEARCESEHLGEDGNTTQLVEKEESEVPMGFQVEDCTDDVNVGPLEQDAHDELPESLKEGENQRDSVQVGGVTPDQVEDGGCPEKPLEDENTTKVDKTGHASSNTIRKMRVRVGRRCGLCGTGTDGKPPKKLVQDGAGSDHEAYSGSSASEEPNYDQWDGFGDEPGWLGRLLGPINDRHGIAGIWVHQHCAVWSPEVYFAGLGCLKNVRAALCRGRVLKCTRCGRPGATIGCRVDRCPRTYHLPCARANGCIFDHRKFLIACTDHRYLYQPQGSQYSHRIKKMKAKKIKMEIRKLSNDAWRKDVEAEEKWLENCGEDEEFLKRESKRLHRDLLRIAPIYIGGSKPENETQFEGWESVAGLQDVIQCMKEVVILPLLYPEFFSNMGLTPPRGVLLHGYPGTGKTLVVRALIGSCARGDKRIAYFARKGADCLGKYVGDAERQLRLLFQVAEKSQPSIIFFDEIDGLAPCRTRQQDQTHNSVVSTLLALLDGLKSRGSVVVIGATNRPDAVDPALRRPGRFDREIYFPLPSVKDRAAILSLHTRTWPKPVTGSLLNWIARRTVGFAGADLQSLCTQTAIIALRRNCPFQELLSAAEKKGPDGKHPPLPTFAVEERDWLEALSCAPPPCSQRGAAMAANDVVTSPLHSHLIPCLLEPLSKLLVSLYLDERILLPSPLYKAARLIKSVVVYALDKKKVPSDHWWSHIHDLLQEVDVMREIGINLSCGGILGGQASDCNFDAWDEDTDDGKLEFTNLKMQQSCTRTGLLQNLSYGSGKDLGFRMLISGSPKSGQRYLASFLLHCFSGNVEIQKVDLATISQEGHGDVMQGLTRILMRCASVGSCMIFMPRIDLWAIETFNEVDQKESDSAFANPESSEELFTVMDDQGVEKENQSCQKPCELSEIAVTRDASQKMSHIWSLFVEQVESICVSTSLMILATAAVSFPELPLRIRHFFKSEVSDCSLSTPLYDSETIPRFSVHLDGSFNRDTVINSSAVELSNNIIQEFVQLIHHKTHVRASSCMENKSYDTLKGDANAVCHNMDPGPGNGHKGRQSPESPVMKISCPSNSRPPKGKSSCSLAVSTFGNQILRYPHFAELCWVTSKLKEGPCADINGPLKGWPFNSCIVRPIKSLEKVAVACSSNNINSKEKSGLVRGLIAVGLLAYKGVYTSLREVSSEVRKVLELLAGEINAKIQAGKDRYQFIRLLSQMAYLEDVVNSWAYTLQSSEVDAQTTVPTPKMTNLESLDDYKRCEDNRPQSDGCEPNVCIKSSNEIEVVEVSPRRFDLNENAGDVDPNSEERGVTNEPPQNMDLHHSSPDLHFPSSAAAVVPLGSKLLNEQNGIISKPCTAEIPGNHSCVDGDFESMIHSNGFAHSDSVIPPGNDPYCSGELGGINPSSSQEVHVQQNGFNTETGIPSDDGKPSSDDEHNVDVNCSSPNTTSLCKDSGIVCFYRCCAECLFNLHDMMRKILNDEWGLKSSDCTVEDVHDMVELLSVNLHSAIRKLFVAENSSPSYDKNPRDDTIRKLFDNQEMDSCQCKGSENRSMMLMDCRCHPRANSSQNSQHGFDLRFIYRDGVLSPTESDENGPFHCKFETLCLCSFIECIAMTRQPSD